MTVFTLLPSKLFGRNKYFINISLHLVVDIESTKIQYPPVNAMLHLQVDIESTEIQYRPVNAMLLMKGGGY